MTSLPICRGDRIGKESLVGFMFQFVEVFSLIRVDNIFLKIRLDINIDFLAFFPLGRILYPRIREYEMRFKDYIRNEVYKNSFNDHKLNSESDDIVHVLERIFW